MGDVAAPTRRQPWQGPGSRGNVPLSGRILRFAREYIVDFNATAAAKRAGYVSKSSQQYGSKLLKDPRVKKFVEDYKRELLEDIGMDARAVLMEVVKVAKASIADFTRLNDDGDLVIDFSKTDPSQLAAIQSVEIEMYVDGKGENARPVKRTKVRQHNKMEALGYLLKHYGLLIERYSDETPQTAPPAALQVEFIDPDPAAGQ
jgi:phage terminase small subunit